MIVMRSFRSGWVQAAAAAFFFALALVLDLVARA